MKPPTGPLARLISLPTVLLGDHYGGWGAEGMGGAGGRAWADGGAGGREGGRVGRRAGEQAGGWGGSAHTN